MSNFVYITFDLAGQGGRSTVYDRIKGELEQINFEKYVQGKRKKKRQLPFNMYVAEFDDESFDRSAQLVKHVDKKIKKYLMS